MAHYAVCPWLNLPYQDKSVKIHACDQERQTTGLRRAGYGESVRHVVCSKIVDPITKGDPESPLLWTSKSTLKLAAELTDRGYPVSSTCVGELLHELDFSLQANKKTLEGVDHPDRNEQFEYIQKSVDRFQEEGKPVISVDSKKKETIGNSKNNGKEYSPKGKPVEVNRRDNQNVVFQRPGSLFL